VVSQLLGPDAVRSHAAGMGVTWLSSLYWNQVGEYALSITMVSVVGLTTVMSFTFCGNPLPSPQSCGTASSMSSQNFTSCAVTGVPLDHM